jgi:hypothetical protein
MMNNPRIAEIGRANAQVIKPGDAFGIFTIVSEVPREECKNYKHREFIIKCNKGGIHRRMLRSFRDQKASFCSYWAQRNPGKKKEFFSHKVLEMKKYGPWEILERVKLADFGTTWFRCKCSCCGEEKKISTILIKKNKIPLCTKEQRHKERLDQIGRDGTKARLWLQQNYPEEYPKVKKELPEDAAARFVNEENSK